MVDTKHVKDRRILQFSTIDAELHEAQALAIAEHAGRLTQLGNWSLGQAINHLAIWSEYAFTGTPSTPPWFVRLFGKLFKRRILTKGFGPGMTIPGVQGGTHGVEPSKTDIALKRLRAALERLARETPAEPNKVFGRLTREEWIALQLRHGELHLGFFKTSET